MLRELCLRFFIVVLVFIFIYLQTDKITGFVIESLIENTFYLFQ